MSPVCIAQSSCDSISFYKNGKISYLKTKDHSAYSIYKWYNNGHIQSRISSKNYQYYRTENYEDGSVKFDTASNNAMNFCEHFYGNGILQKRIIEYKSNSSYFKTDPTYSLYQFDSLGEVSLIIKKDMAGKVVVNEKYPFEKFKKIKNLAVYYPDKNLRQYGYYSINKTGDTLKSGSWFSFYPNGQIADAGLYINNIPWGLHLHYDSLGSIVNREYFINGSVTEAFDSKFVKDQSFIVNQYNDRDGIGSSINSYGKPVSYYYYKGLQICEVPDSKKQEDSTSSKKLVFPLFEYYSGCDYFMSNYYKPLDFRGETEMIYGQVANKWEYNGKAKTNSHYVANNRLTGISAIKQLKLQWREYNDSTGHLFVTLPCGNRIELIDREVKINGYWEFVTSDGIKIFEGKYNDGQEGVWIEYYSQNGNPRIVQNVDYDAHAKGVYKEYHRNGKKKISGKYNRNRKKKGVWKEFTEAGQKVGRARFINDYEYGIVISGNGEIKENGKSKRSIYLYWKGKKLFSPKRKNRPIEKF